MRPPDRIHIVGASGSGTTSLAGELATRYGHRHLDTDDYFWLRTVPPTGRSGRESNGSSCYVAPYAMRSRGCCPARSAAGEIRSSRSSSSWCSWSFRQRFAWRA